MLLESRVTGGVGIHRGSRADRQAILTRLPVTRRIDQARRERPGAWMGGIQGWGRGCGEREATGFCWTGSSDPWGRPGQEDLERGSREGVVIGRWAC